MGIADGLHIVVKGTTLCGREEHNLSTFLSYLIHENFQLILVVIPSSVTRFLLFFIIMSELHKDVVTFLQGGEYLVQTIGCDEGASSKSTLSVIGDGYFRAKPACDHLSP